MEAVLFHGQWRWRAVGHLLFDKVWGQKWTQPYTLILKLGKWCGTLRIWGLDIWGPFLPVPSAKWHVCSHLIAVTFPAVNVTDGAGCHCHLNMLTSSNYFPSVFQACLKPCYAFCSFLFFPFSFWNLYVFFWHEERKMGVGRSNQIHMFAMHFPWNNKKALLGKSLWLT